MVEVSVLVVSHVRIVRDSVVEALASAGLRVRGAGVLDCAALAEESLPSVLLIDAAQAEAKMVATRLREANPSLRVLILATREHEEDFLTWANIGISGYLEAETALGDLAGAVRRAHGGEVVCPPRMAALLMGPDRSSVRAIRLSLYALTARERQVAASIAAGRSNKEIGRHLGVTLPTVKNHVHNILAKWEVRSRGEAAAAYRQKVSDAPPPHLFPPHRASGRAARVRNGGSGLDGAQGGTGEPTPMAFKSPSSAG